MLKRLHIVAVGLVCAVAGAWASVPRYVFSPDALTASAAPLNRLTNTWDVVNGGTRSVASVYDLKGNRTRLVYPGGLSQLLKEDSCPYEYVGFVVLLDVGITLTGFHDGDVSQRAVTAFRQGRWDHLKNKFKRLRIL